MTIMHPSLQTSINQTCKHKTTTSHDRRTHRRIETGCTHLPHCRQPWEAPRQALRLLWYRWFRLSTQHEPEQRGVIIKSVAARHCFSEQMSVLASIKRYIVKKTKKKSTRGVAAGRVDEAHSNLAGHQWVVLDAVGLGWPWQLYRIVAISVVASLLCYGGRAGAKRDATPASARNIAPTTTHRTGCRRCAKPMGWCDKHERSDPANRHDGNTQNQTKQTWNCECSLPVLYAINWVNKII